jgi:ubiquinone/menaquinone biosynthesis C-methylase UbiE
MTSRYQYFKEEKDKEFVIASMKKYVNEKQEIDKFLEKLISPFLNTKSLKILDACCGIGHISYFLSKINPNNEFLGIDQTDYLINEAKKLCKNEKNIEFKTIDVFDFTKNRQKEFDICINWKTLSWIPYYEDFIKELFKVTKKHIFLSSLFYEGDIDFQVKVREFQKESGKNDFNLYYNVYSLPKFKKYLISIGAKNIHVYDFKIQKDIEKPPVNQMGTYTEKISTGDRLQISGIVIMNWKIIHIEL